MTLSQSHSQSGSPLGRVRHDFVQPGYEILIMGFTQTVWVTRFSAVIPSWRQSLSEGPVWPSHVVPCGCCPLLYCHIQSSSSHLCSYLVTFQLLIVSSFRPFLVHFNQVKEVKLTHPLLHHVLLTSLQSDLLQFRLTSTGRSKTRQNIPDATSPAVSRVQWFKIYRADQCCLTMYQLSMQFALLMARVNSWFTLSFRFSFSTTASQSPGYKTALGCCIWHAKLDAFLCWIS